MKNRNHDNRLLIYQISLIRNIEQRFVLFCDVEWYKKDDYNSNINIVY